MLEYPGLGAQVEGLCAQVEALRAEGRGEPGRRRCCRSCRNRSASRASFGRRCLSHLPAPHSRPRARPRRLARMRMLESLALGRDAVRRGREGAVWSNATLAASVRGEANVLGRMRTTWTRIPPKPCGENLSGPPIYHRTLHDLQRTRQGEVGQGGGSVQLQQLLDARVFEHFLLAQLLREAPAHRMFGGTGSDLQSRQSERRGHRENL